MRVSDDLRCMIGCLIAGLMFLLTTAMAAFPSEPTVTHATDAKIVTPILYEFSAEWCKPCRAMKATIRQLELEGYIVRRIDGDASKNAPLVAAFKVTKYPTFVAVAVGKETGRIVGSTTIAALRALLAPRRANHRIYFTSENSGKEASYTACGPGGCSGSSCSSGGCGSPWLGNPMFSNDISNLQTIRPAQQQQRLKYQSCPANPHVVHVDFSLSEKDGDVVVGTGVIVAADGKQAYVVTCAHACEYGYRVGMPIAVYSSAWREQYAAMVVAIDRTSDTCTLRIKCPPRYTSTGVAVEEQPPRIGDSVQALGFREGGDMVFSCGKIIRMLSDTADCRKMSSVETSCETPDGCSGGAIMDATSGRLVATISGCKPGVTGTCGPVLCLNREHIPRVVFDGLNHQKEIETTVGIPGGFRDTTSKAVQQQGQAIQQQGQALRQLGENQRAMGEDIHRLAEQRTQPPVAENVAPPVPQADPLVEQRQQALLQSAAEQVREAKAKADAAEVAKASAEAAHEGLLARIKDDAKTIKEEGFVQGTKDNIKRDIKQGFVNRIISDFDENPLVFILVIAGIVAGWVAIRKHTAALKAGQPDPTKTALDALNQQVQTLAAGVPGIGPGLSAGVKAFGNVQDNALDAAGKAVDAIAAREAQAKAALTQHAQALATNTNPAPASPPNITVVNPPAASAAARAASDTAAAS
jgi:thiol-disulfide isomerase/thioredoxin